ncbi:MAG: site-specific integrase [Candidatus Hydrogenedentes bacterium]|nr:site-specific integrase [Candidatus Hydrogenedentota bacterium]
MGRKRQIPGLYFRGDIYHIDKQVRGYGRLCESTGTGDPQEAERYLVKRLEEIRLATVYGVRPQRTFLQAATKYLNEGTKRSLNRDAQDLAHAVSFIGELPLEQVHMGTLQGFIAQRKKDGVKGATVNRALAVVRRVLNLAARLWRDEQGRPWLLQAPLLQFVQWQDVRKPYPLSWDEQRALLKELPAHLAAMALFKVNTGCREQEVCQLRWDWEVQVPELNTSVFLIPGDRVKNGEDRLVVLNRVAASIVEARRGKHPDFVFAYPHKGALKPVTRICNSAWKRARKAAGLPELRVHDLKHTFGRRLRAAGVPLETRKVLLGHRNGDITSHYSAPELQELLDAANRVCEAGSRKTPAIALLRRASDNRKLPENRSGTSG